MKETPIFEEVFRDLVFERRFGLNLLVGGLLCFIPVINIFAFGYLYRFSLRARRTGQLQLPEWEEWRGLFLDGLRFTVVWLIYWLLPLLLALGVSAMFRYFALGALAYLLLSTVFLLSPVLFSSALYRFQKREDFRDLLELPRIFRMSYMEFPRLVVPAFVFLGIFILLRPLYGFAVFGAFLFLTAHTALSYRAIERKRVVSL